MARLQSRSHLRHPDRKIRIAELGPEAQDYLALLITESVMNSLEKVSLDGVPPYIEQFDQSVAMGGSYGNQKWVGLGSRDKKGNVQPIA